jgi:3-hydroxyacyl-CoA dehydrogenase/enoyl-CoA hydratase/3-hydroxybutyryl-CoA epimerase
VAFETLHYEVAANGVARITIDVQGHKHNVITPEMHVEIGAVARQLATDEQAVGAVIRSGKASFMAGGDLKRIGRYYDQNRSAQEAYKQSRAFTESLRALETCGKPVAVAINGTALGGGLELALACHHRVVLDDETIMLGLPEVTLGLIPGAGGTQRLPRMIGIRSAAELVLSGKRLNPAQALEAGIVDAIVPQGELFETAEQWVLDGASAEQPWDRRGFRIPGGSGLSDPRTAGLFIQLTARVSAEHRHNYPAPIAALRAMFNGTTVKSMDQALQIESREFSALTRDPVARNIIRTLFINRGQQARADRDAPDQAQARNERIVTLCRSALEAETRRMRKEGISPQLIRNAAFAAGIAEAELPDSEGSGGGLDVDAGLLGRRLLSAQSLAAAEAWVENDLDPVAADLASVLEAGFPSYTGGVMSYVDTLGLGAFIEFCDGYSDALAPSSALRKRAALQDRIYPPAN